MIGPALRLRFLGAAETVTGSRYLVAGADASLLVDCGLFQGYKALRLRNWEVFPIEPRKVGAVVLTHSHLDHSGYLPRLAKLGFRGPIHCTAATAELCAILLPDAGRLQEEEAEFANRKGFSRHAPALPLYTEDDALRALELLESHGFDEPFEPTPGLRARLLPAGHILGAASVHIASPHTSVLFSGDLGRSDDLLMKPPADPPAARHVVVESTYGDRLHEDRDALSQIAACVNRVAQRGGVMVVPAFAVGRAQALLYAIHTLKATHRIPDIPVFLNSPMAVNATDIFHRHQGEHRLSRDECAGMYAAATMVRTVPESMALNERSGPMIIISASGMATGGRVLHHLKAFAPNDRNLIMLTGFQAAATRGAALEQGAKEIKIFGQYVPVRAEVANIDGLSAHADYGELLAWLRKLPRPPARIFITHGEPSAADALRVRIESTLQWSCRIPQHGEWAELREA